MSRKKNQGKRKDSRGRILRTGESQHKDGTYDYRYTDTNHKRCSIYAATLEELRQKVDELNACKTLGMEGCTSVVTRIWEKYNQEHVIPLPKITPHTFRHTFCTRLASEGIDLKSLQYLMGHSDVSVTLNVYTHTEYSKAQEAMSKICSFTDITMPGKKKNQKLG